MSENYSLQLNTTNPISNNIISFKISPSILENSLIVANFMIINLSTNQQLSTSENQTDKYSINSISIGTNETAFQIQFTDVTLSTTPVSIQFKELDSANPSNVIGISNIVYVFLLTLDSISTNSVKIIIPNRVGNPITLNNLIIMNLSTNQQIVNSQNQTDNYSISEATITSCIITFPNISLNSTPISIQFKELDFANPPNIIAVSTVLNIFPLKLDLISTNSVKIIIPNRIGNGITLSNLIIRNLSTSLNISNYSISQATSTSCLIDFPNDFLISTSISIQFKELDSANPPNIIAISTFAYINFPSPYDSTIEISKPYLVKYIGKIFKVKITLNNRYDNTLPTEYKNIIYKATKQ